MTTKVHMSNWILQAMSSLASEKQQDPPQVTRNDHGERVEYCGVQSPKMLCEMEQSCKEIVCLRLLTRYAADTQLRAVTLLMVSAG